MTNHSDVPRRNSKQLGNLPGRLPLVERQLYDTLFPRGQSTEAKCQTFHRLRLPRRVWRLKRVGRWFAGQALRGPSRTLARPSERMRDVPAHAEHVPIEQREVVHATAPKCRERHLHDLLCQILSFRYTTEVPKAVKSRPPPESPAKLRLGGSGECSARPDAAGQLCVVRVLQGGGRHSGSLQDLFL